MAFLTHQQGEFLDNIEIAIGDGKNYIEEGNEKLIEAKVEHKKSRKVLNILFLIFILFPMNLFFFNNIVHVYNCYNYYSYLWNCFWNSVRSFEIRKRN